MKTDVRILNDAYRLFNQKLIDNAALPLSNALAALSVEGKRYWMNKDVARLPAAYFFKLYVNKHALKSDTLLTFGCEGDPECALLQKNRWDNYVYERDPLRYDVQEFDFEKKDYDFAMINQTFEHLTDINSAIAHISGHLVNRGYFYSNWPVMNIRHMEPFHFFTGLTVTYIIYLCMENNFDVLECGTWGNKRYVDYIFSNQTWPDYTQVGIENDVRIPCIGWILARKKNR